MGGDVPDALRALPAGKYIIQRADQPLSNEEEEGLITALESIREGKGVPHEQVHGRVAERARR